MIRINQLKLSLGHNERQLWEKAARTLRIPAEGIDHVQIVKQSIDARKKPDIYYSYIADITLKDGGKKKEEKLIHKLKDRNVSICTELPYSLPEPGETPMVHPPVIIGMGPAGLFCGLILARMGYKPILLERGEDVDTRTARVEAFWNGGELNPASNVQFGEGGAGTFSDGKLNTLVKDSSGRNREVLRILTEFGADPSIQYVNKPHIGTDVLSHIVKAIRQEIIEKGGQVRFLSQVTDLEIEKGQLISLTINHKEKFPAKIAVLAIGHSARDTFEMLYDRGVPMEPKAFAVGLRIQHPQKLINLSQYGMEECEELGAASYKLTKQVSDGRGVYSFCMCPGGYVVNASSEPGRLAVNGMSYHDRAGENANSALIVTVTPEDFSREYSGFKGEEALNCRADIQEKKTLDSDVFHGVMDKNEKKSQYNEMNEKKTQNNTLKKCHPLAGIEFQRNLEEKAYHLGCGKIPVQLYEDFKENRESSSFGEVAPAFRGQYSFANLRSLLPEYLSQALIEAMGSFGRMIPGFDRPDAIFAGIESRTSSPVRIPRETAMESAVKGLFPCGEGAGYAGGITSAAMDGIKTAEEIIRRYSPQI